MYSCEIDNENVENGKDVRMHYGGNSILVIKCDICSTDIYGIYNFSKHYEYCGVRVNRPKEAKRSANAGLDNPSKRKNVLQYCQLCEVCVPINGLKAHIKTDAHRDKAADFMRGNVCQISPTENRKCKVYLVLSRLKDEICFINFFNDVEPLLRQLLTVSLSEMVFIKYNLRIYADYAKIVEHEMVASLKHFEIRFECLYEIEELASTLQAQKAELAELVSESLEIGSGWSVLGFKHLEVTICKLEHIPAGSFIPVPRDISAKRCITNVQNYDLYCFKWTVFAAIASKVDGLRGDDLKKLRQPRYYKIPDIRSNQIIFRGFVLKFYGMSFPSTLRDIKQFEMNNTGFSFNVYELKDKGKNEEVSKVIGPSRRPAVEIRQFHINMLALMNPETNTYHFCLIRNMSRLLKTQFTASKRNGKFCDFCQSYYHTSSVLDHGKECGKVTARYAERGSTLKFERLERKLSPPVVIYADIEAIPSAYQHTPAGATSTATKTPMQKYRACAVSCYIKHTFNPDLDELLTFDGKNCMDDFILSLEQILDGLYKTYWHSPTVLQENDIYTTKCCYACGEQVNIKQGLPYCNFFTGKFMGSVHAKCESNFKFMIPSFPVFFHNLSRYDIHLLTEHLGGKLNANPHKNGLYTSLTKNVMESNKIKYNINFLDANGFLSCSLDQLVSSMDKSKFKIMKINYSSDAQFDLMREKRVFPYDYFSSSEVLNEACLPSRQHFFTAIKNREHAEQSYNFAQRLWSTFRCKTLRDYMLLYLQSDVLILADVFENLRAICLNVYDLDPCNYETAPALAWDAMLKYTRAELDLISNADTYNFLKSSIREGLIQCAHRVSNANNKYMKSGYNPQEQENFLACFDANNAYDWAMSQKLPISDFVFLNKAQIKRIDFAKLSTDDDYGYILQVDLEYPDDLHDQHNWLPFCAENESSAKAKRPKLIADLWSKQNYIIHLRNLQLCLQHGLVLKCIHRVLRFKQSDWLKPYITLNTELRKSAKCQLECNFYDLMNKAIYGRSMENAEERRDVRLVRHYQSRPNSEGVRALIAKSNMYAAVPLSDDLVGIELLKFEVFYDKPIYVAGVVLELSKWLVYDFYYNFLAVKANNAKVLYIDTDAVIISTSDDIYEIIKHNSDKFDTSNYSHNNRYSIQPANENVLGLMKDANAGRIMKGFAGLKAKTYAYITEKTTAELNLSALTLPVREEEEDASFENDPTFDDYFGCARGRKSFYGQPRAIKNRSHQLYVKILSKFGTNSKDDKRFLLADGVSSLAWGHHRLIE